MRQQTLTDLNFNSLSNANLVSCFKNFVLSERKITRQVLECIAEIDRRKLYIENNHTSLFDFLVKDFGYSPGAAMRRIDGARLLRELPEVAEKFENGSLTLSQATQVQRASRELKKTKNEFITSDQKRDLVLQIENSSQKETEQTIAAALDLPIAPTQKEVLHKNQSVTLTVTFTPEQMQILEQVQNMVSHSVPNKNWADVFTYLAKKEVARRTNVRSPKNITVLQSSLKPIAAATTLESRVETKRIEESGSNHSATCSAKKMVRADHLKTYSQQVFFQRPTIPAKTRKKLLNPTASCEHRYSNGKRCANTKFLQVDHIKSWSRGGTHDPKNLQVLCGVHNRLKYLQE